MCVSLFLFLPECVELPFFISFLLHLSLQLSEIRNLSAAHSTETQPLSLTYDNFDGSSNFDASVRTADDESRARVSFIGAPTGVISTADPPEFSDNFGETSQPRGTHTHTRVPEFPPRSRFENRKLEQASVSSPSSPECDEVL